METAKWPAHRIRGYEAWLRKRGREIPEGAVQAMCQVADMSKRKWLPEALRGKRKALLAEESIKVKRTLAHVRMAAARTEKGNGMEKLALAMRSDVSLEGLDECSRGLYATSLSMHQNVLGRRWEGSRTEWELLGLFLEEGMSQEVAGKVLRLLRNPGFDTSLLSVCTLRTLTGRMDKVFGNDVPVREVNMWVESDGGQSVVFYYRDSMECIRELLQDPRLRGLLYTKYTEWNGPDGRKRTGPAHTSLWWKLHQRINPRACVAAVQVRAISYVLIRQEISDGCTAGAD